MNTLVTRKIVKIDPDKCTGCGLCVPGCAEGAIEIVDGKARLAAENLCDGLGNCLGECPEGAITIEERPADEFDEQAVEAHKHRGEDRPDTEGSSACTCPGAMLRKLDGAGPSVEKADPAGPRQSQLRQFPVQLTLLPEAGAIWQDADVLISADCVPFAMADFHERLLAGKTLAVGCPKLDDPEPYAAKLARIFAANKINSVTVARMEVPCCGGLVRIVNEAMARSGRTDIPVTEVMVGIDGSLQ